jgi:hypothetical protein
VRVGRAGVAVDQRDAVPAPGEGGAEHEPGRARSGHGDAHASILFSK